MAVTEKRGGVWVVGVSVSLMLALAGCAGSSSTPAQPAMSTRPTPTLPPVSSLASTAPAPTAADPSPRGTARLSSILLTSADLPSGWAATDYKPDSSAAAENAGVARCAGVLNTFALRTADEHGKTFSNNGASVDSEVASMPTVADVAADRTAFRAPKYGSCYGSGLKAVLQRLLPAGRTVTKVVSTATAGPTGTQVNVAGAISVEVDIQTTSGTIRVFSHSDVIIEHLLEVQLDVSNVGTAFPAGIERALIAKLSARTARA